MQMCLMVLYPLSYNSHSLIERFTLQGLKPRGRFISPESPVDDMSVRTCWISAQKLKITSLRCLFMTRGINIKLMLLDCNPSRVKFQIEQVIYNTLISQVLRFCKICNNFDSLKTRVINLYNRSINLGYNDETKLKYSYHE